jgi:drug/metabolite transporter (DMT)-like permease
MSSSVFEWLASLTAAEACARARSFTVAASLSMSVRATSSSFDFAPNVNTSALNPTIIVAIWPMVEPVQWPEASLGALGAAAYVTGVALIVGYVSWFRLVEILPTHIASLSSIAVPATAMVTGALMLGEAFGPREIVALGLMLGALALVLVLPALLQGRARTPQ